MTEERVLGRYLTIRPNDTELSRTRTTTRTSTTKRARMNMTLTKENSLDIYRRMRRIRTFEERVGELFVRQQTAGSMLHLSIAEEAAAVDLSDETAAGGLSGTTVAVGNSG